MHAFCRTTLILEIATVLCGALALYVLSTAALQPSFESALTGTYATLSIGRVAAWSLGLLLIYLIAKTLEIPQTMAATGLFYIQATTVAVGQILAHWLVFRTGLPL
jgi:hypothetical protein